RCPGGSGRPGRCGGRGGGGRGGVSGGMPRRKQGKPALLQATRCKPSAAVPDAPWPATATDDAWTAKKAPRSASVECLQLRGHVADLHQRELLLPAQLPLDGRAAFGRQRLLADRDAHGNAPQVGVLELHAGALVAIV